LEELAAASFSRLFVVLGATGATEDELALPREEELATSELDTGCSWAAEARQRCLFAADAEEAVRVRFDEVTFSSSTSRPGRDEARDEEASLLGPSSGSSCRWWPACSGPLLLLPLTLLTT
jgi:hypothetical protein